MNVRVRFAPSPTGYLHIGGARTALFNWLYARHTGGVFVLRIEDTDAARNTTAAVQVILDGLRWLGMEWDEGPTTSDPAAPDKGSRGPYFQSRRSALYQRRVEELLSKDRAYRHEGAIKFRMTREPVLIPDVVAGDVRRELTDREQADPDFVVVRSDGQPVFHFVNVVDDLEMGITHVIRGEDHLSNTAKHIALFRAFDTPPPKYAHIPLILNPDGSKMSKRDTGASLNYYVEENYSPEAVLNYLCLLGWSPKGNREKLAASDMIQLFDVPQILRANARFDAAKLAWLNGEYLRETTPERFCDLAIRALNKAGIETKSFPEEYVRAAIETCRGKVKLLGELPAYAGFYFKDDFAYDAEAAAREFTPENLQRLTRLRAVLEALSPFDHDAIAAAIPAVAKEFGVKTGVIVHPTRLACCGATAGPSLYHLMAILGKDRVLQRLDRALNQKR
jgi:glutamyl-tRNA synthetase